MMNSRVQCWVLGFLVLGCSGQTLEPVGSGLETGGAAGSSSGGTSGTGGTSGGGGSAAAGGSGGSATGCSLAVVASGNLPAPLVSAASLDGIAVVATDAGFVIAHRDRDPAGSSARTVVTFLSDAGTLGTPAESETITCPGPIPHDGVGAAYRNGTGLVTVSLPNCDSSKGAGAVFLPFDGNGNVSNAAGPQNSLFTELTLGRVSAVAPGAVTGDFEFLYRVVTSTPVVERLVLTGSTFKSGVSIEHPLGEGAVDYGLIATSSNLRATMGPAGGETVVQLDPFLGDQLDPKGTLQLPYASWGALTVWDNRVAAVVPIATGLSFVAGELGGNVVNQLDQSTLGQSGILSAAMTTLADHLFVATASLASVRVIRIDGIHGGDIDVNSANTAALPSALTAGFDGSQLAAAAARGRVAVAWLTAPQLTGSELTGHWALLECPE